MQDVQQLRWDRKGKKNSEALLKKKKKNKQGKK